VGTGDRVIIGGIIVSGDDPKRVLLRAIGPSLAPFGITNPLADPVLELHAPDGSLITTNDNWMDSPDAGDIEATGLAPQNDLESAIVATLDPGPYDPGVPWAVGSAESVAQGLKAALDKVHTK